MKWQFYDVKKREKVQEEVIAKVEYKVNTITKYAVKAKTFDGRSLTAFVSKEDYDTIDAPIVEAEQKKAA